MSEKVVPAPAVGVELVEKERKAETAQYGVAPYKGFVAGVFSGVMKLTGMSGAYIPHSLSLSLSLSPG